MSPVLDSALIERARASSRLTQRPVVAELHAISVMEPRQLVRALAQPFGLTVMEAAEMFGQMPAFDRLPLAQAMARHCVLLRDGESVLTGVIADPFDVDLQTWLAALAGASALRPLHLRLALQADVQAYLSKQEESARAIDTLVGGDAGSRREASVAQVLSFASVSEAASPAVKLVNSACWSCRAFTARTPSSASSSAHRAG
jgi:general secretion pathway protein E